MIPVDGSICSGERSEAQAANKLAPPYARVAARSKFERVDHDAIQLRGLVPVSVQPSPSPSPRKAILRYLDGRSGGSWPVSIAHATRAVREEISDCELAESDLADMITIAAVEKGCNIAFDSGQLGREPI